MSKNVIGSPVLFTPIGVCMRTRPISSVTAICAATLLIAACVPTNEPIDGVGGDHPTSTATADPTPSENTSNSGAAAGADATPAPAGTPIGDVAGDGSAGGGRAGDAADTGGGADADEGSEPSPDTECHTPALELIAKTEEPRKRKAR